MFNKMMKAVLIGLIAGGLIGFADSYGYAITGYTTAELALLVAPAIVLLFVYVLRVNLSLEELIISIAIATGFSLSTTITSGMFITYGFLSYWSKEMGIELEIPSWIYGYEYVKIGIFQIPRFFIPYLFLTTVSASGFLIAYVLRIHFIEKERLAYPIGTASALITRLLRYMNLKFYLIPLALGFSLQIIAMTIGMPFLDLTPFVSSMMLGTSFGIRFDVVIFLLALLIPLGACTGIAIGNLIMFLVITPILLALGVFAVPISPSMKDIIHASAPSIAAAITGYVALIAFIYMSKSWRTYVESWKFIIKFRGERQIAFIALIPLSLATIFSYFLIPELRSIHLFWLAPLMLLAIHPFLSILNMRASGETGIASQAVLPVATAMLYASGARGASIYAYLDPFTGITMPQVIAGVAGNISKLGRVLGVPIIKIIAAAMLGFLLGAPVTLGYGVLLVNVYGFDSPKMPLDRWIPIVTWMSALYSGEALKVLSIEGIIAGVLIALFIISLRNYLGLGIAPFAVLVGLTLTPDVALLFIIAAFIKYLALRIGLGVYEKLVATAGIALVGAGLAVITYTLLSIPG
ncbi:MAG: hypothetical protein DRO15_08115 [Thermoprotei archaeon]|nr:MAG: hypothetical protein DRO15_08115 [Thermoprotei archaeon]